MIFLFREAGVGRGTDEVFLHPACCIFESLIAFKSYEGDVFLQGGFVPSVTVTNHTLTSSSNL